MTFVDSTRTLVGHLVVLVCLAICLLLRSRIPEQVPLAGTASVQAAAPVAADDPCVRHP